MAAKNLFEYYTAQNKPLPSLEERGKLYEQQGLGTAADYISKNKAGDIAPNTALLAKLQTQSEPAASPAITAAASPIATSDEIKAKERADAEAKKQADMKKIADIEIERRKFEAGIKPAQEPVKPDLKRTFEELRTEGGIVKIEDEINAIRSEKADLLAQFLKFKREEPKGVAQGFAQGRISDEQQGIQDRIDFLTRQENASVASLNNKNKYIETVMKLTGDDYDNATARYDKEFSQNLQLQTSFQNYKTDQEAQENRIRDDSRAYLTSVGNLIKDSGKSWEDIDEGMKADIHAAELRAGYAMGTMEAFARAKPEVQMMFHNVGTDAEGNQIVTIGYKDPATGKLGQVEIVKTGGVSGNTGTTRIVSEGMKWEDYLAQVEAERGMTIDPNSSLYKETKDKWEKEFSKPKVESTSKFTAAETRKLEQAGLLNASRQEQLDHLYGKSGSSVDWDSL